MSLKNSKLIALLSAGAMVVSSMSGLIVNSGAALANNYDNRSVRYDEANFVKMVIIDPDFVEVEAGEAGIVGLPGADGEQYYYGRTDNQDTASKKDDNLIGGGATGATTGVANNAGNNGFGYWAGNNQLDLWGVDYVGGGWTDRQEVMNNGSGYGGIQNGYPNNALSQKDYFTSAEHQNGGFTHTFGVFRYNTNMRNYPVYNRGSLVYRNVTAYQDYDANGDGILDEFDGTLMRASLMAGELVDPAFGNMYTTEQMGLNPSKDNPSTTGFLYAGIMLNGGVPGEYELHPVDSFVQGQVRTMAGTVQSRGTAVSGNDLVPATDAANMEPAQDNANFGVVGDNITWTSSDPSVVELMYGDSRGIKGEWIKYHVKKPGESTVTMKWTYWMPDPSENGKNIVKEGQYSIVIRVIGKPQSVEIQNGGDALNSFGITNGTGNSFEVDQNGYVNANENENNESAYYILDNQRYNYVAQARIFDTEDWGGTNPFTYANSEKYFTKYWYVIGTQKKDNIDGLNNASIDAAFNSNIAGDFVKEGQVDYWTNYINRGNEGLLRVPSNAGYQDFGGNIYKRRYGFNDSYSISRQFAKTDKTNLQDPRTVYPGTSYKYDTTWVVARTATNAGFRAAFTVESLNVVKDRNFDFGMGAGPDAVNTFGNAVQATAVFDMRYKTNRATRDVAWDGTLGMPVLLDFNPARHSKNKLEIANASGDRVDGRAKNIWDALGQNAKNAIALDHVTGQDTARNYDTGYGEFYVVEPNTQGEAAMANAYDLGKNGYVIDEKTITVQIGGLQTTVNYAIADDATLAVDNAAPATEVAVVPGGKQIGVIAGENAVPGVLTVNVSVMKGGAKLDTKALHINVVSREAANNAAAAPAVGSDFTIADVGSYRVTGDGTVELVRYLNGPTATVNTVEYKGVTYSVTSVGDRAFAGLDKLTTVTLGSNVTKLGKGVFKNCKNLRHVYVNGPVTEAGKNMFYQCGKVTLHIGNAAANIDPAMFHNNKVKVK